MVSCSVCKESMIRRYNALCSSCQRIVITEATRLKEKIKNLEAVDIKYRKHVQALL